MTQSLAAHYKQDSLLPRAPGGLGVGAALAFLVHAALLVALTLATQWRTRTPEVISAELWAAVPQAAAPLPAQAPPTPPTPVAPPPPAPRPIQVAPKPQAKPEPTPLQQSQRDADIATEQARKVQEAKEAAAQKLRDAELKRKTELAAQDKAHADKIKLEKAKAAEADKQARAERLKAEQAEKAEQAKKAAETAKAEKAAKAEKEAERKAALAQAKAKADEARQAQQLAQQREENLSRIMGQAGPGGAQTGSGGAGTAAQASAPSASYVGRLVALIRPNIVFTGQVSGNPAAEVEVRAAAGGAIISRELVKSSGSKEWDEAVLRAIDRTAALPRDTDGRVPSALILVFRPNQ